MAKGRAQHLPWTLLTHPPLTGAYDDDPTLCTDPFMWVHLSCSIGPRDVSLNDRVHSCAEFVSVSSAPAAPAGFAHFCLEHSCLFKPWFFDSRPQLLTGMRCFVSCTLLPWPLLLSYLLTLGGPASCHGRGVCLVPPTCLLCPTSIASWRARALFVRCLLWCVLQDAE